MSAFLVLSLVTFGACPAVRVYDCSSHRGSESLEQLTGKEKRTLKTASRLCGCVQLWIRRIAFPLVSIIFENICVLSALPSEIAHVSNEVWLLQKSVIFQNTFFEVSGRAPFSMYSKGKACSRSHPLALTEA